MTNDLPILRLPHTLNYVAAFITMQCHLSCKYCINSNDANANRRQLFNAPCSTLAPDEWIKIINRIPLRDDLPVTLCGGEPLLYTELRHVLDKCNHYFDLLTALPLSAKTTASRIGNNAYKFQRPSPYPAIRVSYHPEQNNYDNLVAKCLALSDYGFFVSDDKPFTNVGIWMVAHPDNPLPAPQSDVYFELKPFLGVHGGETHGTYVYPDSIDAPVTRTCECKTSELLIDPLGRVFQCHAYLYNHWLGREGYDPIGSMLDPKFTMDVVDQFRTCNKYGQCSPCDVKLKTNRFQEFGHASVEIKEIR